MARDKKRILRSEFEVDHDTGEVKKEKYTVQFAPEPNYVKLYLDCLGVFSGNAGLAVNLNGIFLEVLKLVSYADDDQLIVLNRYIKKRIADKVGLSPRRIEQALGIWVENKVLIRVARGIYQLNPYLFGKGDWRDVESLRASMDFVKGVMETEKIKTSNKVKNEEEIKITM